MDDSKYQPDKSMTESSDWLINHMTNVDPSSLSPYQETMLEGLAVLMVMNFLILLFK